MRQTWIFRSIPVPEDAGAGIAASVNSPVLGTGQPRIAATASMAFCPVAATAVHSGIAAEKNGRYASAHHSIRSSGRYSAVRIHGDYLRASACLPVFIVYRYVPHGILAGRCVTQGVIPPVP